MFRALFYLLVIFALAWTAFHFYEEGELPIVGGSFGDAKTLASVKAALALHRDISERPISVRARGGVVTLAGEVASSDERAKIEDLVLNIDGVDHVENFVAVSPDLRSTKSGQERSLGERLDDATLGAKVRAAFALHRELKELDLVIRAREGTVSLEGNVKSTALADSAIAWALTVNGVEKVDNLLEVGGHGQGQTVGELAARVEDALARNENLHQYRLKASVRNGTIILQGKVENGAERELAELLAERIVGDRNLRNEVRLSNH